MDGVSGWVLEAARKKYNSRDEFSLGKILTELSLVSSEKLLEALETQALAAVETPANRLESLNLIVERFNSASNLLNLINQILVLSAGLVDAERTSLVICDDTDDSLVILRPTGPKAEELKDVTVPPDKGIAGWVCRNLSPVLSNDASSDYRYAPEIDATGGQILCVPLTVKGGRLGAIEVADKAAPDSSAEGAAGFSAEDLSLMQVLGAQAAAAIENARLSLILSRLDAESREREARAAASEKRRAAVLVSDAMLHEMRKSIGPLQVYAKRLREKTADERVEKYGSFVEKTMTRLVSRAEDVVRYLNGGFPLIRDTLELEELFKELEQRSWVDCRLSGVALRFNARKGIRVHADKEMFLRCLENLVQNGREAMSEGGKLAVDARKIQDMVTIRVSDEGPGIPSGELERVFEPFYSNGKPHRAGLGLSIAKAIVEAHGGVIRAEPAPRGASFAITMPAA